MKTDPEKSRQAKKTENRLAGGNPEELRERAIAVRDIRSMMRVATGLDSEHKRVHLADAQVFTPTELDRLSELTEKELDQELARLEILLTGNLNHPLRKA